MLRGSMIVAGSFIVLAAYRVTSSAFSILVLPLEAELGASRATVSVVFTVHMLCYAAVSLASGLVIDRLGPRATIALGGMAMGLGLALAALSHDLALLILGFGVLCGAGVALAGLPANFVILSERFPQRVATAVGIAAIGMGVGVLVVIPLVQLGVDRIGWRASFLTMAGAMAAIVVLCAWLLLPPPAERRGSVSDPGVPSALGRMGEIARSPRWQGFALGNLLMGSVIFATLTHQVALLNHAGWTALGAASVVGIVNALRSGAGPVWGMAMDTYGRPLGFGVGTAVAVVGLLCLLLATRATGASDLLLLGFIVAFGIGSAATLPTNASLANELFTPDQRGIAWGLTDAAYAAGAGLGSWMVGWLFDLTGRYDEAVVLIAVQLIASYAVVLSLTPRPATRRA